MSAVWVDTDFGFDDLWALILLRHLGCHVVGVSLVAGNAPLEQVKANAVGARAAYGFDWPVWAGAARPLVRQPETAQRILGPTGLRSRGATLPSTSEHVPQGALAALCDWLRASREHSCQIVALGPLTNVAQLLEHAPELSQKIRRIVWMGGSRGVGNHSAQAEFNALADPEAAARVLLCGVPVDVVDLTFCRRVRFGQDDLPRTDPLTHDLLGGYLDIAVERGRDGMAIYDPLAALAAADPSAICFEAHRVTVSLKTDASYGATRFTPAPVSAVRLAVNAPGDLATRCLDALKQEAGGYAAK